MAAETRATVVSLLQLPIPNPVGSTVVVPTGTGGQRSVKVPGPASLIINGVTSPLIDVRAMSAAAIAQTINAMGIGVQASVDGNGRLTLTNVTTMSGDGALLQFLRFSA